MRKLRQHEGKLKEQLLGSCPLWLLEKGRKEGLEQGQRLQTQAGMVSRLDQNFGGSARLSPWKTQSCSPRGDLCRVTGVFPLELLRPQISLSQCIHHPPWIMSLSPGSHVSQEQISQCK